MKSRCLSKTRCAVVVGAIFVGGCMVGPDYHAPQTKVAADFHAINKTTSVDPASQPSKASADSQPVSQWWTTFNDPELNHLVEKAAAGNLSLQRAASRIRQARSELQISGGKLLPQLDATGGYVRSRGSSNVEIPLGAFGSGSSGSSSNAKSAAIRKTPANGRDIPATPAAGASASGGGASAGSSSGISPLRLGGPQSPLGEGGLPGVTTDIYQIGFDVTWEIDLFGGTRRDVEAAAADLQVAVEDRRDVLVSLLAEVARDYLQLRGFQRRLGIAQQNLKIQEDTLDLVRSRRKAGFVTDLDVARAQALVAQTQATIPLLETQVRMMIHALGVLAGEEPDALADELGQAADLPATPPNVPVGIPSDLLKRRPDVRRAERQTAAAVARIGSATAELYPKFSISGTFGLDSSKFKHLLDWQSRYFLFSPGVSWPVFEGGRIRANIAAREEIRDQGILTYEEAVLTALREVEDALVSYSSEQQRHRMLDMAVKADRDAVELARQQYQRGVIDFQSVLDTQRQLLSAEDDSIQSDQTITTDLVALYKALGGGWEVEPAGQK